MSQERRVLSLMHWMQMLRQDIDIQRRSKDGWQFFLFSLKLKISPANN